MIQSMGKRSWIVLLGGNELNGGLEVVARRYGAGLVVVDWNARPQIRGDAHIRCDIKHADAVLEALEPLIEDVHFACTSSDVATETVARLHARRGLRRPASGALALARHKLLTNAAWRRHGLLSKSYRLCRTVDELADFDTTTPGATIVKPASGSSSRGITVLRQRDIEEGALAVAWRRAASIDTRGEVLAEEFASGTEFTVEMVGDGQGHVRVWGISRKYHTVHAGRSRVAVKLHYNPPDVSRRRQVRLAAFARRCYRALGLQASLGHLEVIELADGRLVPLELGARSSGFILSHLVDAAAGLPQTMLEEYEAVLRGGRVTDGLVVPRRSAMYFFYDFPPGFGRRNGTSLVQHLPPGVRSLAWDRSRLLRGQRFDQIDSDHERHGFEILVGEPERLTIDAISRAEADHRLEFVGSHTARPGASGTPKPPRRIAAHADKAV
ncbi:MAG: ATP-grasp domain-containing protein [Actinobacteria bacterium]|nr:MAG: ATP-grasp domain-containing protein [Actinomycetota bacterium]